MMASTYGRLFPLETRPYSEGAGEPVLLAFWEGGSVRRPIHPGVQLTIGRAEDCEVRIDHPSVSRRHARIEVGRDELRLVDLGSSNGTKVGGQRLAPNEALGLAPGILIEIGAAMIMIRGGSGAAPASTRAGALADPMEPIHRLADHVARATLSVILLGETGVGKEVMAERIHKKSLRGSGPLVKINCAALPEQLLEAELFGYERGAFTGANQPKPGLVEAADGGTLFLDELGEMPLATQAKLLRVVENREVMRLGALKPRSVDVRFVAATNRDLEVQIASGQFRQDLFYRMNGMSIAIPPLRERPAEIPVLAREFVSRTCRSAGRREVPISDEAMALIVRHAWPGNVRELRNVMERAVVLANDATITPAHLPGVGTDSMRPRSPATDRPSRPSAPSPSPSSPPGMPPFQDPSRTLRADVEEIERQRIFAALERYGGNQTKAAEALGISRRTLLRRLDEYAFPRPRKS